MGRRILVLVSAIRLLPHAALLLLSARRDLLESDLERWTAINSMAFNGSRGMVWSFFQLMTFFPEYRAQFYHRAGWLRHMLRPLCRPMPSLYIDTNDIGPGLFIQHGFCSIISAKSIGKNCWINQQVTIGFSNEKDCPTIGDNVVVHAGAKVIGAVNVGSNVIIGANAVVVKDVPDNCTVVGVPAYIVKRNGASCREPL